MAKMTYEALIDAVASRSGQSNNETRLVLEALEREVVEQTAAENEVAMGSFGKFVRRSKVTKGYTDPQTGQRVTYDQPKTKDRVDFISGEKTKRALNG